MNWSAILENTVKSFIGINAVYFAIAAIGLNVQFGDAGLLNFGQAAFMAAGAYGLGMTAHYFDISFWWGIPIGIGYALILGLLMGLPTLRLSRVPSSSAWSSSTWANFQRALLRSPGVVWPHSPAKAAAAAATAASTSALSLEATSASDWPVAGSSTASVAPLAAATHSPPMKFWSGMSPPGCVRCSP